MSDYATAVPSAHSAAVYRYAVELVEDTRRANDTRMADARDLAAVVRIADEPAADRILAAAEEACARDLHIAEQQAEEVVRHARSGILAAVQRYAQALVEDARSAGQARLDKATELAELVRLADASSADRLLQAIHTVNEAAMRTAERQANGVLEAAQTRLTIASRVTDTNNFTATPVKPPEPAPVPSPSSTQEGEIMIGLPETPEAQAPPEESVPDRPPVPSYYSSPTNGSPERSDLAPGREVTDPLNRFRPEES